MLAFDGTAKVPLDQLKELAARPAERNEIGNQALKDELAAQAEQFLKQGEDYDRPDSFACEFGYLFEIEDHGLEALFNFSVAVETGMKKKPVSFWRGQL